MRIWRKITKSQGEVSRCAVKIAIIVHVYYHELWNELSQCVKRVAEPYDLYITYQDEDVAKSVKEEYPEAKLIRVSNVGYDIWPFLKVLNTIKLEDYDYILKLHTKRDIEGGTTIEYVDVSGTRWRNRLLSFVSNANVWRKTISIMDECPEVGMVADPFLIFDGKVCSLGGEFERSLDISAHLGLEKPEKFKFVGGTMFLVRSQIFKCLQGVWHERDFDGGANHRVGSLAHVIERLFGVCCYAKGYRILDCLGVVDNIESELRIKKIIFWMRRFLYQKKITKKGYNLVKILRLPVLRRKVSGGTCIKRQDEYLYSAKKKCVEKYDLKLQGIGRL